MDQWVMFWMIKSSVIDPKGGKGKGKDPKKK